jgi:Gas vesicle synthesis protein GvpO
LAERKSSNGKPKPAELVREAVRQMAELTGRTPESVLGLARADDDGWNVTLELVELQRVPSSTDLLGCYVVQLDKDGDLVGYERKQRYVRGKAEEGR